MDALNGRGSTRLASIDPKALTTIPRAAKARNVGVRQLRRAAKAVRPRRRERVLVERLPDDAEGRRQFRVERLDGAGDYFVTVTAE
jgi:hypothetical protein